MSAIISPTCSKIKVPGLLIWWSLCGGPDDQNLISKFTPSNVERERYIIIYVWKILENLVPNLVKPLQFYVSDRRGRMCSVSHVRLGHTGSLAYSSFRWKGIRMFNSLAMHIRNITACSPSVFKKQLDLHLSPMLDFPCTPNFNNSLDLPYPTSV